MRNRVLLWIFILLLLSLLAKTSTSLATDPGVTDDQVLVGAVMDLTGHMAFLGKEIIHGAELYFRHLNEQGGVYGRKVKLLVEDDMAQFPRALAAAKKLVEREKIFCFFSTLGQGSTDTIVPFLEKEKIPLVAPFSQNSDLVHPPKRYIFQATVSTEIQGRLIIDFIVNHLRQPQAKIGTLVQADIYGEDLMKGLTRQAKKYDLKFVAVEKFKRGAVDFSPQLQRLRQVGAEMIVVCTVIRETAAILKEVKNMGWAVQVIGPSATSDPVVLRLAGDAGDGYISMSISELLTSNHPGVKLYKEVHEKYDPKHKMGAYSQMGFEAGMVLAEGLRLAGKDLTRENLVQGLEKMRDFNAMGLSLTFGPDDREGGTSAFFIKGEKGAYGPITGWMMVTD